MNKVIADNAERVEQIKHPACEQLLTHPELQDIVEQYRETLEQRETFLNLLPETESLASLLISPISRMNRDVFSAARERGLS